MYSAVDMESNAQEICVILNERFAFITRVPAGLYASVTHEAISEFFSSALS